MFAATWHTSSAVLAPIRIGIRPSGLLYGNRGLHPNQVSPQDLQSFQLFFGEAIPSPNRLADVLIDVSGKDLLAQTIFEYLLVARSSCSGGFSRSASSTDCKYAYASLTCEKPRLG